MLHAQLYFLFVFEALNLIFMLFGVNKVLVIVLVLVLVLVHDMASSDLLI